MDDCARGYQHRLLFESDKKECDKLQKGACNLINKRQSTPLVFYIIIYTKMT
jgi:hypothetical protein